MIDSALIFATIVQLIGVWRAEREIVGEQEEIDTGEFLAWLKRHKFDDLAEAIAGNAALLVDLQDQAGEIHTKLDQILEILDGGEVGLDISPETLEFMEWFKPQQQRLPVNGSLVKAMVKLIGGKYHGITVLGGFGGQRLLAFKGSEHTEFEVNTDDWAMMKSDLEQLSYAGVFDADYEMDNDRFMVTRKLEEVVEEQMREHVESAEKEGGESES